jgi:hypothetical protein
MIYGNPKIIKNINSCKNFHIHSKTNNATISASSESPVGG